LVFSPSISAISIKKCRIGLFTFSASAGTRGIMTPMAYYNEYSLVYLERPLPSHGRGS
jgi:hypothetical protein